MATTALPNLERRLRQALGGNDGAEVLTDAMSRGRYATDASAYQIMPAAVVVPRTMEAALTALQVARDEGVPITARGGGTSQCGQTVNSGVIIDGSKHLTRILELDVANQRCVVEPGLVLDALNRQLKPHGLWFPVDVSTASRATIGGMAGNNSCGGRSLRYGTMRDNVLSIDAAIASGQHIHFGPIASDLSDVPATAPHHALFRDMLALGSREADEVKARFPKVQRRVGGYNLDALDPQSNRINTAHLLVGSEGTLAYTTKLELKLWPLIRTRAVGVCHFGSFYAAMNAAQHLVKLKPIAVELVDSTMIELARAIAMFRPTLDAFVKGEPAALLLVEFAEEATENTRRIAELRQLMGDLGFGWDKDKAQWGGVVEILDPTLQTAIADVRTSGLNIMMSMKDERKPVSFVEDCAVPLEHLAEYTTKLTDIFERHGTRGTWYAHASEGCLHVRPVLNLKQDKDLHAMRAIAEEAFALVRAYKGSHSGEHGDGIVRSEFHAAMYGDRIVRAFEAIKDRFDPAGVLNPGKIVRAPRFDDRKVLRYGPAYQPATIAPQLDWSDYPGAAAGLQGAVEMCNNNGACRKNDDGAMCPSYRVTRDEQHVTRGRANALRLALSGQLGPDAFSSDAMAEAMQLCVSCKACRRECPTGVDMARMKLEVQAARLAKHGYRFRDRLIAFLPRYAPYAAQIPSILGLRDRVPGLARATEAMTGLSSRRTLPRWRDRSFNPKSETHGPAGGAEVVLLADTFNRYFEPHVLDAALAVLIAGGYRVTTPKPSTGSKRPLCCGRTFLAVGDVARAKEEASRTLETLAPLLARGVPVVGLEPSCLLGFRDEIPALIKSTAAAQMAEHALTFEEFLARDTKAGRLRLDLGAINGKALVHGHCHQKAFGAFGVIETVLRFIPRLEVETINSSCCGMAGSFGYQSETIDASLAMAELSLLPAVRAADRTTMIVADGTSCRHQVADGTGRKPLHVAEVLAMSLTANSR